MNVFDYIEKELDRIEVGYTSYDGTKITLSMDDVRELIQNIKKKYKSDGDVIYRQAAIDALDEIEAEVANGYGYQYAKWREYFVEMPSAQPPIQTASNYLQSLPTSPLLVGKMPSAQPDRSLWFRIGELCVGESKGDISAEMAVEKIRELLREAERRKE